MFLVGAFALLDRARDLGGDAPAPARVRQQAFLPQQVRLPRRVAAFHARRCRPARRPTCTAPVVQAVAQMLERPGGLLFTLEDSRQTLRAGRRLAAGASRDLPDVAPVAADDDAGRVHARSGAGSSTCTNARAQTAALRGMSRARLARRDRALAHRLADLPARCAGRVSSCCSIRRRRSSCHSRTATCCTPWDSTSRRCSRSTTPTGARRAPPVRDLQPAHGVRDARPQELRRAAFAGGRQRRRSTGTTRSSSTTRSRRSPTPRSA